MTAWITYTMADRDSAERIERYLEDAGVRVLNDAIEVLPGDNIVAAMAEAVEKADLLLVIVSDNSNDKRWFSTEISLVVSEITNNPSKKLIPIVVNRYAKIPEYIRQYQPLYLFNSDSELEKLSLVIRNWEKIKETKSDLVNVKLASEKEHISRVEDSIESEIYKIEMQEYEAKLREYDIQYRQKQRLVSSTFLFSLVTATVGVIAALATVYFEGSKILSNKGNVHTITDSIPVSSVSIAQYVAYATVIIISVVLSVAVNLFINSSNKK